MCAERPSAPDSPCQRQDRPDPELSFDDSLLRPLDRGPCVAAWAEMAHAFDSVRRPSVPAMSAGTMGARLSAKNYRKPEAIASPPRIAGEALGPVCWVPVRRRLVC